MESSLFLSDLLTGHEPFTGSAAIPGCGFCGHPCPQFERAAGMPPEPAGKDADATRLMGTGNRWPVSGGAFHFREVDLVRQTDAHGCLLDLSRLGAARCAG